MSNVVYFVTLHQLITSERVENPKLCDATELSYILLLRKSKRFFIKLYFRAVKYLNISTLEAQSRMCLFIPSVCFVCKKVRIKIITFNSRACTFHLI